MKMFSRRSVLGWAALAGAGEVAPAKRHDVAADLKAYPQGTPKEAHDLVTVDLRSPSPVEIKLDGGSRTELATVTAEENEYRLTGDARDELGRIFGQAQRGEGFGNARYARTIFEQALNAQALRLAGAGIGVEGLDAEELSRLTAEDFGAAARAVGAGADVPLSRRLWRRAT